MFFWFTARSIGCESFFFQYIFQIYFRSVLSSKTAVSISCNWPYTVSESRPFLAFYTSIDAASHEQQLSHWQCRRIMHYARAFYLFAQKPSKIMIFGWFWVGQIAKTIKNFQQVFEYLSGCSIIRDVHLTRARLWCTWAVCQSAASESFFFHNGFLCTKSLSVLTEPSMQSFFFSIFFILFSIFFEKNIVRGYFLVPTLACGLRGNNTLGGVWRGVWLRKTRSLTSSSKSPSY